LGIEVRAQLVANLVRGPLPVPAERGLGDPQPRLDPLGIHFEMKLHAPRTVAQAKRLSRHVIARREQVRASGEIEGILVPLENPITGLERAQQDVALSRSGEAHRLEAKLAHRRSVDPGTEGAGQHLRPEADAEHRQPGVHRPPHQISFGEQIRVLVGLVNIHLAAEDDEAVDLLQVRPPGSGLEGVKAEEWNGSLRQHPCADPKGVIAIIPNAKNGFHRVH